jgi:hypothetical protein
MPNVIIKQNRGVRFATIHKKIDPKGYYGNIVNDFRQYNTHCVW